MNDREIMETLLNGGTLEDEGGLRIKLDGDGLVTWVEEELKAGMEPLPAPYVLAWTGRSLCVRCAFCERCDGKRGLSHRYDRVVAE